MLIVGQLRIPSPDFNREQAPFSVLYIHRWRFRSRLPSGLESGTTNPEDIIRLFFHIRKNKLQQPAETFCNYES